MLADPVCFYLIVLFSRHVKFFCLCIVFRKLDVNFISTLSGGVLENMKSLETL